MLPVDGLERADDLIPTPYIELARRFVDEQEARTGGDAHRQGRALPCTGRETIHCGPLMASQTDEVEDLLRVLDLDAVCAPRRRPRQP
jgi:hypothetical protein